MTPGKAADLKFFEVRALVETLRGRKEVRARGSLQAASYSPGRTPELLTHRLSPEAVVPGAIAHEWRV